MAFSKTRSIGIGSISRKHAKLLIAPIVSKLCELGAFAEYPPRFACSLLPRLAENLIEQFIRRPAVSEVVIIGIEVFHALSALNFIRQIVLGDIDAQRIRSGARATLAAFLHHGLTFP